MEGVSVRKVAAAAGVSLGLVQHHFPTKRLLLAAAMDRVDERFAARSAAADRPDASPADRLLALAEQLVPLDAERRAEGAVWLAFVARAAVDAETAAQHARGWQQLLEDVIAGLLGAHAGRAATGEDRERAAALLATLDGLAVSGVVEEGRVPPERLRALVARAVALSTAGPGAR